DDSAVLAWTRMSTPLPPWFTTDVIDARIVSVRTNVPDTKPMPSMTAMAVASSRVRWKMRLRRVSRNTAALSPGRADSIPERLHALADQDRRGREQLVDDRSIGQE